MPIKIFVRLAILLAGFFSITAVNAGNIVQCGSASICSKSFTIQMNGNAMGGGDLIYDAKTGDISLSTDNIIGNGVATNGGIMWTAGNGNTISVGSLSGNADPILGFGVAASTTASSAIFAFAFDLPIAIEGTIETKAKVSYTLSSTTAAGAQIKGIGGNKVVQSWDVDSSIGSSLVDLNKNVDVGDTHFHTPGPDVTNSPVYSANSSIVGSLGYDLMSVLIHFNLSANSNVGISGFVSQTPVPLPGAAWLMLTGIGFLAARRKTTVS